MKNVFAGLGAFAGIGLAAMTVGSCVPVGDETVIVGPQGPTSLTVVVSAEDDDVAAGTGVTLTASASGGTPPYLYRWNQNAGPVDLEFAEVTSATLITPPITTLGGYVFRVTVTDDTGATETDFLSVEVTEALTATTSAESADIFEGMTARVTAAVVGANPPFTYSWTLESGPAELDLDEVTTAELVSEPLTTAGEYVFQVTVTDTAGVEVSSSAAVTVVEAVTAEVPVLAVAGEPVALSAEIATDSGGVTVLWEVVGGAATIADPDSLNTTLTTEAGETVDVTLTAKLESVGDTPVTTSREFEIASVLDLRPQVLIETNLGEIVLELDAERAPKHTANFLLYVDDAFYDGLFFHRAACNGDQAAEQCDRFVLQGGGYRRVDGEPELQEPVRDPVASEADNGLSSSAEFSLSMALTGNDPNSAETQFFINLSDNGFLDDQGFTVFGTMIDGADAIDAIFMIERLDNPFGPPGEVSLPAEDAIMERVTRLSP